MALHLYFWVKGYLQDSQGEEKHDPHFSEGSGPYTGDYHAGNDD